MLTRGDTFVLVLSVALIGTLFMRFGVAATPGAQVRVMVGDRLYAQVTLNHDQELHVQGTQGESVIEIKQGRVRFLRSPCTGKQCIHAGWAKRGGEFVACVPNQVSFTVLGQGAGGDYYDSISF